MKVYEADKIRNVVFLGHSGSGKSNLAEAILYTNKVLSRISRPEDQSQMSSTLRLIPVEWNGHKYNFIDTPGYFDFHGELISAMKAASGAIIVVDGTTDLQVGTDNALEITDEHNTPRFIFVNKIDSDKADYEKILEQLRARYGKKIAPFHVPMGKDMDFKGFINVVDLFAREYNGVDCDTVPIPDYMQESIVPVREMLIESVAESDEELLEKFFAGEEFTMDEIQKGLRKGVLSGDIIPVLCGSTAKNIGIHTLLDMIWDFLPSPVDMGYKNDGAKFAGQVFKTIVDPFIGRMSFVNVCEGELAPDSEVYNTSKGTKERVGHIYTIVNGQQVDIDKASAGDIVVFLKLSDTQTGDTLSLDPAKEPYGRIEFPKPQIFFAVQALQKGEEDKISSGLHRIMEEDPSIQWYRNSETKQTLLGGQGEIQINSIKEQLKKKFGVEVELADPKVPYRETIKGRADVQGKHKKQSGGHGQYGDVKIKFEPCAEDFIFEEKVVGGAVPKSYIPAVEKGLREALQTGVLAGYPVTQLKATLYDGSYHDVDSSEMAFKLAANMAFKKGMETANPVLLEPIMKLKIVVPDDYMGDVIGDINKRRGRILGMEPASSGKQVILAEAPQAETFRYAIDLRSMTQGRGFFEIEFERYEEVPSHLSEKIVSQAKNEKPVLV
ncbi:elongation factor G [Peptoclostridium acidaminophilum DSM 3953]|uniref:Elongation factor G n=1 Tax=Peptoclostridium acidaminophilum DSM 3953 TaxID=1286171 RepID=W8U373_PEPAC|nr:elongation factor G [Peptoclostridium acidaminophilum]AHM55451.1 elongation factor G [Peptoclostridium acidaminophilum DSM 3953]